MSNKILILNGPNLNMLGKREPEIYGRQTLQDIEQMCREAAVAKGLEIDFRQSNFEGELVTWIQEAFENVAGIVINPAAYTHTSIALLDALKLHRKNVPVVEVHLSDVKAREDFRQMSYVALRADKQISGKGAAGYVAAVEFIADSLQQGA